MPKRSNQFQKLITAIHACMADGATVEESALLIDPETGEQREVDIFLTSQIGGHPVSMAVEVNDRSRPSDSTWVEQMAGKHQSLPVNKLVLVSRSGFTGPAKQKAKSRQIGALTIEEACEIDWDLVFGLQKQGVLELFHIRFNCLAHIAGKDEWQPARLSGRIALPSGKCVSVRNVVEFAVFERECKRRVLNHFSLTSEENYHVTYHPPEGTLYEIGNEQHALVNLTIGLHLDCQSTPIEVASCRFCDREFGYAVSTEPDNLLRIAMQRRPDGEIEGILYDSLGFRQLVLDKNGVESTGFSGRIPIRSDNERQR